MIVTQNQCFVRISKIVLIIFILNLPFNGAASELTGHWEGAFSRLGAIQEIQFDIFETDSSLTGTYDIPDMILYREPFKGFEQYEDSLQIRLFWGWFTCYYQIENDEITGINNNWNPPVAIHLKRKIKKQDYTIEQKSFKSGKITLNGELLLPTGKGPFPVVIIVEGSTHEGRKLWTYRSIADMFVRHGIATFLYDKRIDNNTTLDDLAFDLSNTIDFLTQDTKINKSKIGLFGISQGGWLAPLTASKNSNVSFAILMAGPAVSVWDQEMHRVEYSMKAGALGQNDPDIFTDEEIAQALQHTKLGFEVVKDNSLWDSWLQSVEIAQNTRWKNYINLDSTLEELLSWNKFKYNPESVLSNLTVPLLALFGSEDYLVPPNENLVLMNEYLKQSGNKLSKAILFEGVGHDFLTGATLIGNEWKWPKGYWQWNKRPAGFEDSIIIWTKRVIDQK